MKLNLKHFYGQNGKRKYLFEVLIIFGKAACELFLTQLNMIDLYTDFAFLTIIS